MIPHTRRRIRQNSYGAVLRVGAGRDVDTPEVCVGVCVGVCLGVVVLVGVVVAPGVDVRVTGAPVTVTVGVLVTTDGVTVTVTDGLGDLLAPGCPTGPSTVVPEPCSPRTTSLSGLPAASSTAVTTTSTPANTPTQAAATTAHVP
jgi:hypothetical protein